MERTAWTDERLDDLSARVDTGFERLGGDIRELRSELRDTRSELRGEIDALRVTILRVGGGMMVGLVGIIAAVVARGI